MVRFTIARKLDFSKFPDGPVVRNTLWGRSFSSWRNCQRNFDNLDSANPIRLLSEHQRWLKAATFNMFSRPNLPISSSRKKKKKPLRDRMVGNYSKDLWFPFIFPIREPWFRITVCYWYLWSLTLVVSLVSFANIFFIFFPHLFLFLFSSPSDWKHVFTLSSEANYDLECCNDATFPIFGFYFEINNWINENKGSITSPLYLNK